MSKKHKRNGTPETSTSYRLKPDTKKSIWAIGLIGVSIVLILANLEYAGPLGGFVYKMLSVVLGWGYLALPLSLFIVAGVFLFSEREITMGVAFFGALLLLLSILGLTELFAPTHGGWLGLLFGSLRVPFGQTAAVIINIVILFIAGLITLDAPLKIRLPQRKEKPIEVPVTTGEGHVETVILNDLKEKPKEKEGTAVTGEEHLKVSDGSENAPEKMKKPSIRKFRNYVPPPLSLLKSTVEKPTTGDLRANANIIRRTLESFGIAVEMGEINIGPKVTRYTLKPAEGVKLSRIMALHQDISLALAAHPIRIEAPIPGKSLVGIEVPNKTAALVRLGSLMSYQDFQKSGPLGFTLGRDVNGDPIFADIERMPHLLVAGSTGSGKSVMIHSIILSLLYKNSPDTLKLILIDPKRVELSIYEHIPHLVSPVIIESKKAINVFRWALKEMDRRYDVLLKAGSRDIKSYNTNGGKDEPLPYILIVVDELADLMTSYGREVEGSIVRLAQMARATGLHLVLSTQRPSVEIITGLIKANITSRIALQVASQIDSRTILDTGGAEKLLGGGDLLFISSELSKPKRIQGAYITEEEIHAVADFVRENNPIEMTEEEGTEGFAGAGESSGAAGGSIFDQALEDDDDEIYDEAVRVVVEAKKASASLLQRRLRVGYARAARLLDIMEARNVIGPGEGAKPREVYIDNPEEGLS